MKNKILSFLIVVVSLPSCNQTKPKHLACKEFDAQCELDKDYQFVKVLEQPDEAFVDNYGMPLIKNQWYLHSSKANVLSRVNDNSNYSFSPNDFEYAGSRDTRSAMSYNGETVTSDTVPISCRISGIAMEKPLWVRLLMFGPRYIELQNDGGIVTYGIRRSK